MTSLERAPAGDVGLPGTRQEWVIAGAVVSGLLLTVRGAERTGAVTVPEPLAGSRALRSWGRLLRVALDRGVAGPDPLPAADLGVVARAGAVLGSVLADTRATGRAGPLARLLLDEAAVFDLPAEHLVAQIPRVHGALAAGDRLVAAAIWAAGASPS